LERHAIPQFGAVPLADLKSKDVIHWFTGLPLAAKTKSHIKSVMRQVFEFAMLEELVERLRNPMDLVRVVGATTRETEPRILTHGEWQRLLQYILKEPMRTMVVTAFALGLRRSELAGLKWSDFEWEKQEVVIQRGVIANRVDATSGLAKVD